MKRFLVLLSLLLPAGAATAQQPPTASQATPMYPAPPPEKAPAVQQGAPVTGLSSPLDQAKPRVVRTEILAESEAQLLSTANRLVWGRYAKVKGARPGELLVGQAQGLWTLKGRIDSVAPGSEGDWATVEGTIEKISAGHIQLRGEAAFRVAKVQNGTPCKVAGVLNFRRSGKSQVWRLAEGDNPCDGTREMLDLVIDKQAGRPVPAQTPAPQPGPRRS
jgi:hypothetical protein